MEPFRGNEEENANTAVVDEAARDTTLIPLQYDITSYGADYDVEGLVKRLNRNDILIPKFQRNYIWTIKEASRFIESLLLGLPIPAIFLVRERDSNKLLVIDGQQRLKTLQFFYNGVFNPKENENQNAVFKLIEVQKRFEELTYNTLEERDRTKLNDSLIHAIIIRQEAPANDDTSIYHIFDRLNSSGRTLTPQEIRTAIHHGRLIDTISELNTYPLWRRIYGKENSRLKDQELILRFLALFSESQTYEKPMNEFLNKYAERNRNPTDITLEELRQTFRNTIDAVYFSIGSKAFRRGSALNAALFDSVMVGIAERLSKGPINDFDQLREAYNVLVNNEVFLKSVLRATSDEVSVAGRIGKALQAFEGVR